MSFPAGPSTPTALVKVYEHKTLGKDRCIGEGEVDVSVSFLNATFRQSLKVMSQIWRHIQAKAEPTAADVQVELTGGTGLLSLKMQFNALGSPAGKTGTLHKLGSPSRFSLSRRPGSDE